MPVAFLELAQQCAPQVTVATLAAVVSVESGFQPFAIRVNSDHPLADQPKTRAEAIEAATILISDGHDIDLGLAGINSGDLGRLGLSVSDTFDFCLNLKASASMLDGYYRLALHAGATSARAETVMLRSYYGHGDASVGETIGYDSRVLAERKRLTGHLETIDLAGGEANEQHRPERTGEGGVASTSTIRAEQAQKPGQPPAPRWDVFNSGRQSSVLVFSNKQKK